LEAQVTVKAEIDRALPVFRVAGFETRLDWPGGEGMSDDSKEKS
jgi:hypothetical protein